jgi:hypothetical protein
MNTGYEIVVSYPPMDKRYMGESNCDEQFWLKRLVPNLVFEDYKALQKVEKCLRMIGIRNFRICSTASLPDHWQYMSRIWICLPRNLTAQTQLEKYYSGLSRFAFETKANRKYLVWKSGQQRIEIESPLKLYLEAQRLSVDPKSEWNTSLRNIVAKDYAVLARFTFRQTAVKPIAGTLKDFFLGGIRGLGTWGAAWYTDRKFETFKNLNGDDSIQLLLEVIYRDGRIFDVVDVSDKPKEYFEQENSLESVANFIKMHKENRILA